MQRFARVGNLGRRIGEDLAGVPQIGPAARRGRDENLVGSLVRTAALFGLKPPTQARLAFIEAEGTLSSTSRDITLETGSELYSATEHPVGASVSRPVPPPGSPWLWVGLGGLVVILAAVAAIFRRRLPGHAAFTALEVLHSRPSTGGASLATSLSLIGLLTPVPPGDPASPPEVTHCSSVPCHPQTPWCGG